MTSQYEQDLESFADKVVAPLAPQAVPDDAAIVKAQVVLRALMAAGLKTQFNFDIEEAKMLWAARLGRFHIDILTEAISDWISQPGVDFPSVGDVEAQAEYVMGELQREYDNERAFNRQACHECDGVRWVRVQDAKGSGTHMRPCPVCPEMTARSELYDRGHFLAEHIERGGCPSCWDYHPSLRHRKAPAKAGHR